MMISTHHTTRITIAATLILSLLLQSCVRREIVKPEFLLIDISKDITVYTVDKREIRFNGSEYKVLEKENKQYIVGKGKQYNPKTNFYDTIPSIEIVFEEIEHVEWRERTMIGTIGDVVFIGSVALIFLLLLLFATLKPSFH